MSNLEWFWEMLSGHGPHDSRSLQFGVSEPELRDVAAPLVPGSYEWNAPSGDWQHEDSREWAFWDIGFCENRVWVCRGYGAMEPFDGEFTRELWRSLGPKLTDWGGLRRRRRLRLRVLSRRNKRREPRHILWGRRPAA